MDFEITLSLGRLDLVIGESTPLVVILTNHSGNLVSIPDPERDYDWPKIRVRHLESGQETSYGPFDLEEEHADVFIPPRSPQFMELQPGQRAEKQGDLLRWASLPAAGTYELAAVTRVGEREVASAPVRVTIHRLALQSVAFVGPHGGQSPFRYYAWSHQQDGASAILLSCVSFDPHAQPLQSFRVAEVDAPVRPSLSVSTNGLPYPAHWVVWLQDDRLAGLWEMQGRIEGPVREHPADAAGARIVGPVLLDLEGYDGSCPGRGHVALWKQVGGGGRLSLHTFEADGRLTSGPQVFLDSGGLAWGEAAHLEDGTGEFLLATQGEGGVCLQAVRWKPGSTPTVREVAAWDGSLLGGGMALDAEDTLHGACLTAGTEAEGQVPYLLQQWTVKADGSAECAAPLPVPCGPRVRFTGAVAGVSPGGRVLAALQATDGRWLQWDARGAPRPLPARVIQRGQPRAAFWVDEALAVLVMAEPEFGLTWHEMPFIME